ncbi:MAG: aminotransferase class IV [Alphaproteobacteria bacterium]
MILWFNGDLLEQDAVRIAPTDRGVTLGDGLFETMRARGGRVCRLHAHLDRLRAGAETIGLPLPPLDFGAILAATLAANGLGDAVLRLTVTRGSAGRGLLPPETVEPTVMVTAAPPPPPSSTASSTAASARGIVATTTRRNEYSPLCGVKSLNYLDNILARMEAARCGADDAILLNTRGRVAETTVANLFVVKGGEVHTPPLAEGALPGVMRAAVLRETGGHETPLSVDDVLSADDVFITNSLGIRPLVALDGKDLGRGGLAGYLDARLAEDPAS